MRIPPEVLVPDSRTLLSSDGTVIYADAIGDRSKPAVVFIHDLWMSTIVFDEIFKDDSWASNVYLVRYDTRGHGRSGQPMDPDAWGSQQLADDFATVVEAFQLDKPFVIGWGLGATTIADILSYHPPHYLSGAIYVASLPYMEHIYRVLTPVLRECLPALTENASIEIYQEAAATFVTLCSTAMSHSLRLACLGGFVTQPQHVAGRLMGRAQEHAGLESAATVSRLPILMVSGKEDNLIVNEEVSRVFEDWADVDAVEMEADHMPWLGDPVTFRHEVLDYVKRVTSRQSE